MAKKVINVEAATVTFDFTKDGGEAFVLKAGDIPGFGVLEGTALHALLHGVSQKVGDSYANAKNQPNPLEWAQAQVKAVIAAIVGGNWNVGRTGEGAIRVSLLARAIHAVKTAAGEEASLESCQEFVDSLTKEQVAEYKGKKKIARAMDTLRAADAEAKLARAKAKLAAGDDSDDDEE